ncbi:MAG TPA: PaaI family thioesterase [Solirubrobacteraceae bacterium]|nr:PaaI family thioesterase [Solirubrobacteraceae bacterium]
MPKLAAATGLQQMRAIVEGTAPPAPIQALIGFVLAEIDEGTAVFLCTPTAEMRNPLGAVHGGIAMTLLDSAAGAAVHTTLGAGQAYATLETKVNLVRAITPETGEVRAEGEVVYRGGRVATAQGRLTDRTGALLAHATSTCLILGG